MTIISVAQTLAQWHRRGVGYCFALLLSTNSTAQELASRADASTRHLNSIVAIDTVASASHIEFRITLAHAMQPVASHFSTDAPARIVVDLPAVDNATGTKQRKFTFTPDSPAAIMRSYAIAQTDRRSRVVLNLSKPMRYTLRSEENAIVIGFDVSSTLALQENAPSIATNDLNRNVSMNFQNIEVRALLQLFADFTAINIVASDSVTGNVSLRLKDVPWQQALDIILQARGLEMQRQGQVIWIAPRNELMTKEKNELEQRAQIAALEPLHTEVFRLNYQKADAFRNLLGAGHSPDDHAHSHSLSRRGSTMVDQRTNQLFVTDTPTVLDNVRKLLAQVDIPSRQVEIEARIVEADHAFSRNLGVRLRLASGSQRMAATYNVAGDSDANGNLTAPTIGAFNAASMALSLFGANADRLLDIELAALEEDGKGQIVSRPRVVTANQQAAVIEQGEEIPYQQSANQGTSVAFKKANLKLEVTPQITPDGNVILTVDINKDSRGIATPGGLAINTKHVKTQVQVENGGTVVIGGIYTQTETDSVSKVPLLGDLPVLGNLFKNAEKIRNKTELLIFLTPKIVADSHFDH